MSQVALGTRDRSGHSHGHDHSNGHGNGDGHGHGHGHGGGLDRANVTMPEGWGKALGVLLLIVGVVALGLTAAFPSIAPGEHAGKHALASYLVGFIVTLGFMLGTLGIVMMWHLVKAGWSTTLRRLAEHVASLMPLGIVLAAPVVAFGALLYKWMDPKLAESDHVLHAKAAYLNPTFFYARLAVYFVLWTYLALRLSGLSKRQDGGGDKWLSNRMSFTSAWGILLFALTVAFASFDLLKSLDYHWFSTMFGVYFFAGNMISSLSLIVLCMTIARSAGRLRGVVTEEHYHDMGKLMLGFTVFWAYIAFSQYFLIWYANIPEETAWFDMRGAGQHPNGWRTFGILMMLGHFVGPFLILLFRNVKRTPALLSLVAAWIIAMHCVDIFWVVRPSVYAAHGEAAAAHDVVGLAWVDITGLLGPLCVMLGLLVFKFSSGPLVPVNDPRLHEALHHKNYV